ncbi:MAG TPA: hypothetical protein VF147_17270, partial [Vicinamibacterales bacterium]
MNRGIGSIVIALVVAGRGFGLAANNGGPEGPANVQRASESGERTMQGLTAVEGIRVGHHTLTERPTGCTV